MLLWALLHFASIPPVPGVCKAFIVTPLSSSSCTLKSQEAWTMAVPSWLILPRGTTGVHSQRGGHVIRHYEPRCCIFPGHTVSNIIYGHSCWWFPCDFRFVLGAFKIPVLKFYPVHGDKGPGYPTYWLTARWGRRRPAQTPTFVLKCQSLVFVLLAWQNNN